MAQTSSKMPDIKTLQTQLLQIMNGDNHIGVDDSTRSLLFGLMQIVEGQQNEIAALTAARSQGVQGGSYDSSVPSPGLGDTAHRTHREGDMVSGTPIKLR